MENKFCHPVGVEETLLSKGRDVGVVRQQAAGLQVGERQFQAMISAKSVQRYSKDSARPYDAALRRDQLNELNRCWGAEADEGMGWAESLGFSLQDLQLMTHGSHD